ncbi:response regulator [Azospirillum agricola]|uniref:response regulator n=1 Tax=Azospirillum agricola TaxID=1720247 RepID=UPI000A0F0050|nr:response regulator [Azospirillum agricola]SMH58302.1 two-component system, chemotaxis family, response regulator CheY [Azospirillum lipoferum]
MFRGGKGAAMAVDDGFRDRSVLVVEDEAFTRMVLVRMLSGMGFAAVHQAADGAAGLAAVAEHRPDLILCDVEMQPMDGFAFVRSLRAKGDRALAVLPVLFMSGRADAERLAEARASGADAILPKPATPDALRRALAERLAVRAAG